MIKSGDLSRAARVQVQDGEERDWRRPWRKRPKWRTVFMGFVESMRQDTHRGTTLEMVDAMSRLRQNHWSVLPTFDEEAK